MWTTLAAVAHQLLFVWAERFRKLCPAGIEAAALVAAVCRGKLKVAMLVPPGVASAKSAAAQAALGEAVMWAWPVLMGVAWCARCSRATHRPAEDELLWISVNAFDPAHAGSEPIESLAVQVKLGFV